MTLIPSSTVDAATRDAVAKLRDSRAPWSLDELQALNEVANGPQRALSAPVERMWDKLAAVAEPEPEGVGRHSLPDCGVRVGFRPRDHGGPYNTMRELITIFLNRS
jgi:hypothetical protein